MSDKIELIQIPFPEEANDKVDETSKEVEKSIEKAVNTPETKSSDLYGGLPISYMVETWGVDKTKDYLDSTADLYNSMGLQRQAKKISKKYTREYLVANTQEKKERAKKSAKQVTTSVKNSIKSNADKAIAKADKWNKKLSGFTNNRKIEIMALVQTINDLPDRDTFENFIVNYFLGKAEKKVKSSTIATKIDNSLREKIKDKTLPLEDIISWAQEIMSLYNAAQGISLDNVVSIVTSLVTLQFQPYITKYNQYVRTVNDLEMLIREYTVIIDAVNNKAREFDSPITIKIPSLPSLPTLPEIPV